MRSNQKEYTTKIIDVTEKHNERCFVHGTNVSWSKYGAQSSEWRANSGWQRWVFSNIDRTKRYSNKMWTNAMKMPKHTMSTQKTQIHVAYFCLAAAAAPLSIAC